MIREPLHADAARHRAHPQFPAARNVHIHPHAGRRAPRTHQRHQLRRQWRPGGAPADGATMDKLTGIVVISVSPLRAASRGFCAPRRVMAAAATASPRRRPRELHPTDVDGFDLEGEVKSGAGQRDLRHAPR